MGHSFTFFRAGGSSYQARLDTGADIAALADLDQKLWVALACPVSGLELDEKTLALVDSDHDGRIRPPEVLAAVAWMERVLADLDELPERTATLDLDQIDDENDEGKELLASAKVILENLGKAKEETISLDDVLDTAKIFSETKFNGDGVVPAESADDEAVRAVIADVIACLGPEPDRSGKPGVSRAKVDAFFEQATALAKWWKAQSDSKDTLPIGERTSAAEGAFAAVEAKIEDYFVRTKLAQFDARAAGPLNRAESDWTAVATDELSTSSATVAAFPLARVEPGRPLSLESGLNPAWIERMRAFERDCVAPLLGERKSITDADFATIRAKLSPYRAHLASKPTTSLGSLARERIESLAGSTKRDQILALIDKDEAVRPQVEAIARVEKLLRYKRDLHRLLCNFVNFRDFYLSGDAVFQAGTLFLDERSCDLCVRVDAAGAHAEIAGASNTFLVYCECTRRGTGDAPERITIAAALTAGDEARVHAARNGVFYDRDGRDWDAHVLKVLKQPISIREAFWLPYRRIGNFIGEQIEKFAGERDKEVEATTKEHVTGVAQSAAEDAPDKPFDVARFAGILAAVGLAIGAIGSALAVILTSFFGLSWWQMPLALVGVCLAISGPSMLIAYVKLRGRMLGPILDGAGWAVNAEARINIAFGTSLTERGELPKDATRIRRDLYPDKRSDVIVWTLVVAIAAAAILWKLGYLKPWLAVLLRAVKK
jgi:hypothetical protein